MPDTTTVLVHRDSQRTPITKVACQYFGRSIAEFKADRLTQDDARVTCPRCLWVIEHPLEHPAFATIQGGAYDDTFARVYRFWVRWAGQVYDYRFMLHHQQIADTAFFDPRPGVWNKMLDELEHALPRVEGWLPPRERERHEFEAARRRMMQDRRGGLHQPSFGPGVTEA